MTRQPPGITRERVYQYVRDYLRTEGWAPSMAEIAGGLGLRSRAVVLHHLRRLQADGRIERGTGDRQIRLPDIHEQKKNGEER